MNDIEEVRRDIIEYYDPESYISGSDDYSLSVHGIYYYETELYTQTDIRRNWIITKIKIGLLEKQEFFFEYFSDSDNICSAWLNLDHKDYLLFPEAQGGQSIFDIQNTRLYSFYSKQDAFIWSYILPSPDNKRLAVIGCYWACPYELVIYDCSDLFNLPYRCIYREYISSGYNLKEWCNDQSIILINSRGDIHTVKI